MLGYDAVDGKLVVNEAEAERARAIFAMVLEGHSLSQVVDELGRRGWSNKTWVNKHGTSVVGTPIGKSSLHHLLTNPLYTGKLTLGDELHEGVHEAIVDEATWNAVQGHLKQRRHDGGAEVRNKHGTLLSGLLKCAACGSSMSHHYASRHGRRYSSYCCAKYTKSGASACPGSRVSAGEIEEFVVSKIRAIGRDPALIKDTIVAAREQLESRRPEIETALKGLERDRVRLSNEKGNLVAAVGAGGTGTQPLVERIGAVEKDLAILDARAQELRDELSALDDVCVDEADLKAALSEFDSLFSALSQREKSRLLSLLITSVSYSGTDGTVTIELRSNGLKRFAAIKGDEA